MLPTYLLIHLRLGRTTDELLPFGTDDIDEKQKGRRVDASMEIVASFGYESRLAQ
jgi:hypothetical protein